MINLRMPNLNRIEMSGRLTKDPRTGRKNDSAWAQFGIAHEEYAKGEKTAEFWEVACFGKTAEIAGELRKGAPVIVEGRLGRDHWTDKDGKERDATRIYAHRIQQLSWPDDTKPATTPKPEVQDDDPF